MTIAIAAIMLAFIILAATQASRTRWMQHGREVLRLGRTAYALAASERMVARGRLLGLAVDEKGGTAARLESVVDSLFLLTADNAAQQAAARSIRDAVGMWQRDGIRPMHDLPVADVQKSATVISAESRAFQRIEERIGTFVDTEAALYARRVRAERIAFLVMAGVTIASLLSLLVGLRTVRRQLLDQTVTIIGQGADALERNAQLERQYHDLSQQNDELRIQTEQLHEQAVELEALTESLQVQAFELEEQASSLTIANAELRRSRDHAASLADEQSALLAALPEVVVILDHDGRYVKVVHQYPHPALPTAAGRIGRRVHDILPIGAANTVHAAVVRAIDTQVIQEDEVAVSFPDGVRWFIGTAVPFREHAMYVAREITERKRDEAALREQHERYRLLSRATNEVTFDTDLASGQIEWNEAIQTTMRYAPGQLSNSSLEWATRVHPDDHDRVRSTARQVIDGSDGAWTQEYRLQRGDGTWASVLGRGLVLRDSTGKALRMIGSILDLTERHTLEAQLRQSQKMDAVGQLAGGVAHDFNNLLMVITGYAGMALDGDALLPDDREAFTEIAAAAHRAGELTRQLLTFSRQTVYELQPTQLHRVVDDTEKLLRRLLPADVSLQVTTSGPPGTVLADPSQLGQVVLNLALNARDAMPDGGKMIITTGTAEFEEAVITGGAEIIAGRYAVLTVSDTGIGMSSEVLDRMFEPFYTTKPAGKGTGLGLATVYGIVRQFGGRITVHSAPGLGATFRVFLPASDEKARHEETATSKPSGGVERVLVVDDDDAVRGVVMKALKRGGYDVLEARDGRKALSILDESRGGVDLLISDVVMPVLGGKDLIAEVRRRGLRTRLLLMSGYSADRVAHAAWGRDLTFIEKPFSGDDLLRRVREVLDMSDDGALASGPP